MKRDEGKEGKRMGAGRRGLVGTLGRSQRRPAAPLPLASDAESPEGEV